MPRNTLPAKKKADGPLPGSLVRRVKSDTRATNANYLYHKLEPKTTARTSAKLEPNHVTNHPELRAGGFDWLTFAARPGKPGRPTAAASRRTPEDGRHQCSRLELDGDFKRVGHGDPVIRNSENGLAEARRGLAFEPPSRTPWIIRRTSHYAMAHSVFVNVSQSGQIRVLICEQRVPILKPDLASGLQVTLVHRASREECHRQSAQVEGCCVVGAWHAMRRRRCLA